MVPAPLTGKTVLPHSGSGCQTAHHDKLVDDEISVLYSDFLKHRPRANQKHQSTIVQMGGYAYVCVLGHVGKPLIYRPTSYVFCAPVESIQPGVSNDQDAFLSTEPVPTMGLLNALLTPTQGFPQRLQGPKTL